MGLLVEGIVATAADVWKMGDGSLRGWKSVFHVILWQRQRKVKLPPRQCEACCARNSFAGLRFMSL